MIEQVAKRSWVSCIPFQLMFVRPNNAFKGTRRVRYFFGRTSVAAGVVSKRVAIDAMRLCGLPGARQSAS
jgi:hypothetical protein